MATVVQESKHIYPRSSSISGQIWSVWRHIVFLRDVAGWTIVGSGDGSSSASLTGTEDVSAVDLTDLTFIVTVDGVGPQTTTFEAGDTTITDYVNRINGDISGITAAPSGNFINISSAASLLIGNGTSNPIIGFTNGQQSGGGIGIDSVLTTGPDTLVSSSSWVVIEPPDSSVQLLWNRVGGVSWDFSFNTESDYSGGSGNTLPTSSTSHEYATNIAIGSGTSSAQAFSFVITAETEAPFGFCYMTVDNDPSVDARDAHVMVPLNQANGFPYAFYAQVTSVVLTNAQLGGTAVGGLFKSTDEDGVLRVYQCIGWGPGTILSPNLSGSNQNNRPFRFPVIFGQTSNSLDGNTLFVTKSKFKGTCDYMQWLGSSGFDKFDTLNDKENIVLGDVMFPWDGTTIPGRLPYESFT